MPLAILLLSGCDMVTGTTATPNADGTYKGDFQVSVGYYTTTPNGSLTIQTRTLTGAVGFTIQGGKVITTPSAGEGQATWDPVNKTMWVDFLSIVSSNESHCSQWKYSGGLKESDQFLKGEGNIACLTHDDVFSSWNTYWKVTRQ